MPEGPECFRMAKIMDHKWRSKTLTEIILHNGRYKKKPEAIQPLLDRLPLKVLSVDSRGKFIYWILRDESFNLCCLFQTMGMSGIWHLDKPPQDLRIEFVSEEDGSTYYGDRRNFGTLKFVDGVDELDAKLQTLGPDVLAREWIQLDEFRGRLTSGKRGQKTLPQLLMDQSIIAGIGNYLKAEVLWIAELSPHRTADSLSDEEWQRLWSSTRMIPCESAYVGKGSSVMTYQAKTEGQGKPYPAGSLAVYKRKIDPYENEVIREETADKRTTWWVPALQK